ncbi:hypothetical protein PP405_14325 [Mycobacteroides abscessus]|nr:hypothetical protein [Mycobacteroides abscessus]MDM2133609.1 hypothetical protein [Mycobacteroides abscessus]MDM2142659.1 hypothetical protein [Mycobacteroides abscessus]MDM2153735.1 hypothetical protein [Mycobacteroides abscessus]MDM2182768.1 hypothetical protein [Mycobacteroides abscessus]
MRPSPSQRRREQRDRLSLNASVLDHCPQQIGETLAVAEVCELLGVLHNPTLRKVLERHGDELRANGWDPEEGTFTRAAVIRVALMLRPSTSLMAGRIAKAVKDFDRLIKFELTTEQSMIAADVLDEAIELTERVREQDPAEVWTQLGKLDDYTIKSVVIALAAMVRTEDTTALDWLGSLVPASALYRPVNGLALLLPVPDTADGVAMSAISDRLGGAVA